jgi:FMN phosphatase YigB (HAD superfamily)
MIRAVTLDFWNTLVEDVSLEQRIALRATRLSAALVPYGFTGDRPAVDRAFKSSWDSFDRIWRHDHRTPTTAESVTIVLGELGVTVPDTVHDELTKLMEDLVLEAPPRPLAGVPETLPLLAERYALAVVCDAGLSPGRTLRKVLELYGLTDHFDFLFFSDEHGCSKPDARAFHTALDALGVKPAEAVHVGDIQRTDIAGAHGAGLRAIHMAAVNASDVPRSTAEAVLYRFADIPATLERLG